MAEPKAIFRPTEVQVGDIIGPLRLVSSRIFRKQTYWSVCCVTCGHTRDLRASHLVRYINRTCTCRPCIKHGNSKFREYRIWSRMIDRCYNPRANNYRFYGGRGVWICPRWRESYGNFIADIAHAPSADHSLDRIDTFGGYTCGHCDACVANNWPANVRWATKYVQHRNQKSSRHYTHNGETLILKDWARKSGIGYLTLHNRLKRGWDFARAISTPVRPLRNKGG